jgi:hypothetical protein
MIMSECDLERFNSKVMPEPNSGCHLWDAGCADGYGRFVLGGRARPAHAVSYELSTGKIVPKGAHVHHRCDNTFCVNPSHLDVVTPAVHARLPRKAREKRNRSPRPESVQCVIDHFGSISAVAKFAGVSLAAVGEWTQIPDKHVRRFATRIPPIKFRPDLYQNYAPALNVWPECGEHAA